MEDSPLPARTLGPDGPPVGAIGLGCMGMSWAYNPEDRDDERSISVIRHALDIGVTLIDTADAYGPYTNEELVGRALEGRRADVAQSTPAQAPIVAPPLEVVSPPTRRYRCGCSLAGPLGGHVLLPLQAPPTAGWAGLTMAVSAASATGPLPAVVGCPQG